MRREPLIPALNRPCSRPRCSAIGPPPTPPATPHPRRAHPLTPTSKFTSATQGLRRPPLPVRRHRRHRAWLAVISFADALVRWFQLLCLTGYLAVAEPKTLRWSLWHAPARLVHRARRHVCASSTAGRPPTSSSPPTSDHPDHLTRPNPRARRRPARSPRTQTPASLPFNDQ